MKIGVLIDNGRVTEWQARALLGVASGHEFLVYNCRNTRPASRRFRYAAYYLLNIFTVRNPLTRLRNLPRELPILRWHEFDSEYSGAWQRFPNDLIHQICTDAPTVIIKFGMGLVEVPPAQQLPVPILSYHHGDPAEYRGRPAGFHELLSGRRILGQIVQKLSNDLDAGCILAFAETKIFQHSYRATLIEAYARSPLLLNPAIKNAVNNTSLDRQSNGPVYRLPGSAAVLRLLAQTTAAWFRRWRYGAFVEKVWQVSTTNLAGSALTHDNPSFPDPVEWKTWPTPPGYVFLADPFFSPLADGLLVEAVKSTTGKGQILELAPEGSLQLSKGGGHYSYPALFEQDGTFYVIPEVSTWSSPVAFEYHEHRLIRGDTLDVVGQPRLLDPTLVWHDSRVFLFGNRADEGGGVLRLWSSASLFDPFEEHPSSPIRISPNGSRMAGQIHSTSSGLFRFGQQGAHDYGDGIVIFRIHELTESVYRETVQSEFRLQNVKGPHTLNFRDSTAVFDWYRERVSPLAGIRRLLGSFSWTAAPAYEDSG